MTFDKDQDRKLVSFLRQNAPEAPSPKPDEMRRILETIEASEKRSRFWQGIFSPKGLVPAMALAGLLALILIPQLLHRTPQEPGIETFLSQTVGDLYAQEDETSEDSPVVAWLSLAAKAVTVEQRDARVEEFLDEAFDPANNAAEEEWL